MNPEVLITGAGPVGLWLAAELRLAGVAVTVLERRYEREPTSKALTIHPRTIEVLASRGVQERVLAEGTALPLGHFAALSNRLDLRQLDTRFPYTLALPQARLEALLEEHARAAGADIRRGHAVHDLSEHPDSVTVHAEGPDGPYELTARYVVGCDGTRSTVRRAAEIPFPGTDSTVFGWLADVRLAEPPDPPVFADWTLRGQLMGVPLGDGVHRLVGIHPRDVREDRPGELTLQEVRDNVAEIHGTDFGLHDPVWLSRFGNGARQAQSYRCGRVLLAGDAAHQHMPAGGVGLNVGVQDAMNLGFRLAAVVHAQLPESALDNYHRERHPVGAELLRTTRAQTALMSAFSTDGHDLRAVLSDLLIETPDFARELAERVSGIGVRYPDDSPDAHPMTGWRTPDLALDVGHLFELLHDGRYVLLDFGGSPAPPAEVPTDVHRVRLTEDRPEWARLSGALIRPDGHVAWAAERERSETAA